MIDHLEENMEKTTQSLQIEAKHVSKTKQAKGGVCWMYTVIAIEVLVMVFLIYIGLS